MTHRNPSGGDLLRLPGYVCAYVGHAEAAPADFAPTPGRALPGTVGREQAVRITARHGGLATVAVVSAATWNDRRHGTIDGVYAELLRRLDLDPGTPGVADWQIVAEDLPPVEAPPPTRYATVPAPSTPPEQPAGAPAGDDAEAAGTTDSQERAFWLTGRYGSASARSLMTAAEIAGGGLNATTDEILRYLGLDPDEHALVAWDVTPAD